MPGAIQLGQSQKGNGGSGTALVDALALGQDVDAIEVVVYRGRRLMDGANDGATLVCHRLQQTDALGRCHFVQATGWFVQEEYVWIVHQLQGDGQSLSLTATQLLCRHIASVIQVQILQNIGHDFSLFVTIL